MTAEERLNVSKTNYKFTVGLLKILPMVIAALCLTNMVLSYFDIDLPVISYIGGVGLVPWLFIMLASYLFRFCAYHRMFMWYVLVNNILCIWDYEYELPVSDRGYLILHLVVTGLFLFFILYLHQREVRKRRYEKT